MIIGVSGKIGSGKDTLFKMLKEQKPSFENKKYAFKLKQRIALTWGVPVENFEYQWFKEQKSPLGMSWRELLQIEGCLVRNHIDYDYWVKALFADYVQDYYAEMIADHEYLAEYIVPLGMRFPNWVVTDVRFPNEAQAILDRGGKLIRLEREWPIKSDHESETALDHFTGFTHTFKNEGSLQALKEFGGKVLSGL